MNIILHLPPETEAKLLEQARVTGTDAASLALDVVQEKFASTETVAPQTVSMDEWLRLFDEWVGSHESRNPHVDDSRDSIYPDRW